MTEPSNHYLTRYDHRLTWPEVGGYIVIVALAIVVKVVDGSPWWAVPLVAAIFLWRALFIRRGRAAAERARFGGDA